MNAREQAREAAKEVFDPFRDSLDNAWLGADAASDVWEPIVRDLMGALEAWNPNSYALARAKEALG